MKVLLTGMTPRQCGPVGADLYYSCFRALDEALRLGGHETEWRVTVAGEDLRRFDVAVIGIHGLLAMPTRENKFGALWAMHELPHVLVAQDWRVRDTFQQLRCTQSSFWKCEHLESAKVLRTYEEASKHYQAIDRARDATAARIGTCLLMMQRWGDPGQVHSFHRVESPSGWCPDPFVDYEPRGLVEQREHRWVCSSFADQSEWLDTIPGLGERWEVLRIHPDSKDVIQGGGRRKRGAWRSIPEPIVRDLVEVSWGCLLPYYGKYGMRGWWRSRYKTTAVAGSVLWTDPAETEDSLGVNAYSKHTVAEIEGMRADDLRELAYEQTALWAHWAQSAEQAAAELTEIVKLASPSVSDRSRIVVDRGPTAG